MDENTWIQDGVKHIAVTETEAGSCEGCELSHLACWRIMDRPGASLLRKEGL